MSPLLASFLLGLIKGLVQPEGSDALFSLERDLYGPAKEELVYRGLPIWAVPQLPFGTTAVAFAVDHVLDDMKVDQGTMTAEQLVGRFGDVFLGGCLYEAAMRKDGLLSAIAAHGLHNSALGLAALLRRRA